MKIVYLIAGTYRPAGMERVLAGKADWLAAHGYDVVVVTTDQQGREPAFGFAPSIKQFDLDINYEANNGRSFADKLIHYPFKQLRHRRSLSRLLKELQPDVTVSMFCNDASFVPRIKDGSMKVLEVHFSRFKRLQYGRRGIWALADRYRSHRDALIVRRFDRFVVLTDEDKGYWGDVPGIVTIPNPRTFTFTEPARLDNKIVMSAGRYSYQKHFDALLDVWRRIDPSVRDGWTLRIAGDGETRLELETLIDANGLRDSVRLGPADDMKALYASSSVFVLSSRFEGLPMVLLEAQAAGLPVVSFDCKCGPRDVIVDGVDGYLIPEDDRVFFASRLSQLMTDTELRRMMGAEAYAASSRYDEERIMGLWVRLFEDLCQHRGKKQ